MKQRNPKFTPGQSEQERVVDMLAVAILVTQGHTNKEISKTLRMSDGTVRHRRADAHAQGLFTVDFDKAHNPKAVEMAFQKAFRSATKDKLGRLPGGKRLKHYEVVVSGFRENEPTLTPEEYERRLRIFAGEAGRILSRVLTNATATLVTYGTTLLRTFEHTNFHGLSDFFAAYPACCDPFEYSQMNWCATRLAQLITRCQGRSEEHHPDLRGMLPVISLDDVLAARLALRKHVENAPDYKRIFGPGGLADQAECLVTSIGRSEHPLVLGEDYFAKTMGVDRAELNALIAAEIGSVPLPKPNLSKGQELRFKEINQLRLGLSLCHIQRIASEAASKAGPGVVVVAMGANKAKCFFELVKLGLINSAIVDTELDSHLQPLLAASR